MLFTDPEGDGYFFDDSQNLKKKKHNVRRKAFTAAYFKLHSCFALVSDFQLQSNIVVAMGHQILTINHFKACLNIT